MSWEIKQGNCLSLLGQMESESVQTCVTSPPYWGLRDYGTATWEGGDSECDHKQGKARQDAANGRHNSATFHGSMTTEHGGGETNYRAICAKCGAKRIDSQLGLEPTPEQYVENLVTVMREVKRVLRKDGTLWLNLGDSYAANRSYQVSDGKHQAHDFKDSNALTVPPGLKPKDLVGIPWRVAFALQADGWWLRSDIIWSKPNPMPESVTDRPTRSHEYIFLLTKSQRYFYDADAIREEHRTDIPVVDKPRSRRREVGDGDLTERDGDGWGALGYGIGGRNKRSVWEVTTQPYPEAHFATFPPKLIEPCILAGTSPKACGECGAPWERVTERKPMVVRPSERSAIQGDEVNDRRTATSGTMLEAPESRTVGWQSTCDHDDDSGSSIVLDPFAGSGTTGLTALRHGRSFIGCELNPDYCELARTRIRDDAPLFNVGIEVMA